jgi:hypothetical protein
MATVRPTMVAGVGLHLRHKVVFVDSDDGLLATPAGNGQCH